MSYLSSNALFAQPCTFVMGGVDLESLPPATYPEIAFAGRSNVGKSSLVNALTGRRTLAKASNTPGRTREINFFLLAETLMLVDLPGYGYAKVARKDAARWGRLVEAYVKGRANLRRVCLLIDSRHGVGQGDEEIMEVLDKAALSYQIVLTKSDKIKPQALQKVAENALTSLKKHPAAHPHIIATSSQTREGIEALRAELAGFAEKKR